MTTLGKIIYYIAAILAIVITASAYPIYQLFGALVGLWFAWSDDQFFRDNFNCSLGEYAVITTLDKDRPKNIKRYCKILTFTSYVVYVLRYSFGWFAEAIVDILDVISPGSFKVKDTPFSSMEEFEKQKKNFDRSINKSE